MRIDLDGDDFKVVRYHIVFTKPGFELILADGVELINYPTSEGAFRARLVTEFLTRLSREGMPWPPAWEVSPGEGYPAVGQPLKGIPDQELKYVKCHTELIQRMPRADADREKDRLEVLREIRDKLG